jgi:deazaflavin-dependent oxidoreductase (nitroreductase family)
MPKTNNMVIKEQEVSLNGTGNFSERSKSMLSMTRLMPIISWGITLLLRLGVRMTIFGPMMLLTVRGRKTGKPRTQPVDLHEHNGRCFLIATHGVGNWVRNLRVAGEGVLSLGWSRQRFTAVELTPEAGGPIIKDVLGPLLASEGIRGSALRQNIGLGVDASLNDFIAAARSHPVFELSSCGKPSTRR